MSIKQDPVTWYGINYTGTQITQWDFQNKGKLGWTGKSSFVLEVPLRQCNLFRTMWPDPAKGQLPFKRWAHILISTNHPMERFSKNDPWVILTRLRVLAWLCRKEIATAFVYAWLMKGIFTLNPSAKYFLPCTFPWQGLFNPSAGFVIPKRAQYFS